MRDYIMTKGSFQYEVSHCEDELIFNSESDESPETIHLKFKYPNEGMEFKKLFQSINSDVMKTNQLLIQ